MFDKWDNRFLELAVTVASWSKDPSTKVGCVIVRPDKTVASQGYNGFPRGLSDDAAHYADREVKLARTVHAELNAILNAHGPVHGCTLYCTLLPCSNCALHIIQAGIKRVVAPAPNMEMFERWRSSFERTVALFKEAGTETLLVP